MSRMSQMSLIVIFLCALTWLIPMESDVENTSLSPNIVVVPAPVIVHDSTAVRQNNGPITGIGEDGELK